MKNMQEGERLFLEDKKESIQKLIVSDISEAEVGWMYLNKKFR